jgi:hypothetical protein
MSAMGFYLLIQRLGKAAEMPFEVGAQSALPQD